MLRTPSTTNGNDVLEEAAHLRRIAQEYLDKAEAEDETAVIAAVMQSVVRALMWQAEAEGLERGYFRGRIMAAYDVRMGLDNPTGNGSVHFDSDTAPPPQYLVRTAESLARGDA